MKFAGPLGRTSRHLPLAAGSASALFGLVLLAGWVLRSSTIHGNTGICFVLLGLGLVALHLGRVRVATWVANLTIALAGIVFAQYLTGVQFGIDDADHSTGWLGGMAPNAAIGFVMAGLALALVATGRWLFTAALLGSLTCAVGAAAVVGVIGRVPSAPDWGGLADIALPTAAGTTALGLALAVSALERQGEVGPIAGPRRGALLAGITAALVSVLFWYALREQERRHVERNLEQTTHALEREIVDRVQAMAQGVTNLARHGASRGWSSGQDWRADAWLSVGAFPDFLSIEWIDADFVPVLVAAIRQPAPQVPPLASSAQQLWGEALEQTRDSGAPVVAGPFQLGAAESALRIFVPLKPFGAADAYLSGVVSANEAFSALFDHVAAGYAVEMRCRGRVVFRRGMLDGPIARELDIEMPGGMRWSLVVAPEATLLASERSQLPEVALIAGLVIAVLLGSTVWFGEMASRRAQHLEAAVTARTDDLERALEAERLARREATEASTSKDRFLSVVSHELRNPLGSMRTALEVLRPDPSDEGSRAQMLGILERQVKQLGRLVDDLLDVTRIGSGKISLQLERIDLTDVLRHAADTWRAQCARSGLHLDAVLPDHPVWIDGDPARLNQAIDNLVLNATRASDPGGSIELRMSETPDGHVEVTIRDDGDGIAPDELELLFEPFFQSDRSRMTQQGGLGLGLAIFKGLIEGHGGSVSASSPGLSRGAEFAFHLARKPAPDRPQRPAATVEPCCRRVLLIDDHRDSLEGLGEMLRLQGHHVLSAANGTQGLAIAKQETLDVVICDLGLPVMDGCEVVRALRSDPATESLLVIALSGFCDDASVERAFAAGFDHHMSKPADVELLKDLLGRPTGRSPGGSRTDPPGGDRPEIDGRG